MNYLKAVFVILFLSLIVIIAVQNYQTIATPVSFRIDLVFFTYQSSNLPLSFVSIVTFLIGVVVTALYGIKERFRLKKRIKILENDAKQKDAELSSFRNLPVTSTAMEAEKTPEEADVAL